MSNSLRPHGLYSPWNSPGQNTGVGSLSLLQEIISTKGLNPGLPHCKWILYHLSHQGSPWILEWVAYPFCRGSSWPMNWTGVSYIAGRFFTSRDTRKTISQLYPYFNVFNIYNTYSFLHLLFPCFVYSNVSNLRSNSAISLWRDI